MKTFGRWSDIRTYRKYLSNRYTLDVRLESPWATKRRFLSKTQISL